MGKHLFILFFLIFFPVNALKKVVYVDVVPQNITGILGVDVGGTHTDFGVFQVINNKPELLISFHYKTGEIFNFATTTHKVLNNIKAQYNINISRACIGAAGKHSKDYCKSVFMTCPIDIQEIKNKTTITECFLVSDFEIIGYGLNLIEKNKIITLNKGNSRLNSPQFILGAGTGLGTGLWLWNERNHRYNFNQSKVSRVCFTPQTKNEIELLEFLQVLKQQKEINWHTALAGNFDDGITKIYDFFGMKNNYNERLVEVNPAIIFNNVTRYQRCKDAVNLYLRLYVQFVKNMALTFLPYGGLYIVGGIAAKNTQIFESIFSHEYYNSVNESVLKEIPIQLVLDYNVSLYGAAQYLLTEGIGDMG